MLRKAFDFFIFSSLFIGVVAVMMVFETHYVLNLQHDLTPYLLFVFFSTICSYNLHWHFTPLEAVDKVRIRWTSRNLRLQKVFIFVGLTGAAICAIVLIEHWFWLSIAVVLTFLYTAPKLPLPFAGVLKQIAVGKTIFLASVWAYVTALLPSLVYVENLRTADVAFFFYRLFFIYAICIIFDYRDREEDRREGIKSMITMLSAKGICILFYITVLLAAAAIMALYSLNFPLSICVVLLLPVLIAAFLFDYAKSNRSDYFYYFVLDGLMMASALFTPFLSI